MSAESPPGRVVVVGGGFGGLEAVKKLARAGVEVTLVDRHNYFLFQPLSYQVATGGLAPFLWLPGVTWAGERGYWRGGA